MHFINNERSPCLILPPAYASRKEGQEVGCPIEGGHHFGNGLLLFLGNITPDIQMVYGRLERTGKAFRAECVKTADTQALQVAVQPLFGAAFNGNDIDERSLIYLTEASSTTFADIVDMFQVSKTYGVPVACPAEDILLGRCLEEGIGGILFQPLHEIDGIQREPFDAGPVQGIEAAPAYIKPVDSIEAIAPSHSDSHVALVSPDKPAGEPGIPIVTQDGAFADMCLRIRGASIVQKVQIASCSMTVRGEVEDAALVHLNHFGFGNFIDEMG